MPAFYKYFMYTKNMKQILFLTMKNCFRYLKLMSPLNVAICTTISYTLWMILYKKQLFDLEVKGQGPTKVIMVRDTLPYGHAPTYQLSLTYLERQKCYGLDKKILFKKQLFDLELTYLERQKRYGPDKLCWEEAEEAEENIRLKQYVSLRLKGRHNNNKNFYEEKQQSK